MLVGLFLVIVIMWVYIDTVCVHNSIILLKYANLIIFGRVSVFVCKYAIVLLCHFVREYCDIVLSSYHSVRRRRTGEKGVQMEAFMCEMFE